MKSTSGSRVHRFIRLSRIAILGCASMLAAANLQGAELSPFEKVEVPTPAVARQQEVSDKTDRLLRARDTAGLEALADQLRKSREAADDSTWLLSTFYNYAVRVPDDQVGEKAAMDFYHEWARQRPDNITAQVCLAEALTDDAWNARGSGWANSVSQDGWRLFGERLDQAWEVLKRASELPEKCPGWFSAAQTVALGQGWKRSDYLQMMAEAIRREPTFGAYYTNTCYWLLPRWNGQSGDFEKWISDQANTYPPAERDRQYARFVWLVDRMRMDTEMVFAPGRLDWERIKRGFEIWSKNEPGNLVVLSEFARLALLARDRATARSLFEITGGKYFPPAWDGSVQKFQAARRFAFSEGGNPLRTSKASDSLKTLPPEIVAKVEIGARFLGQFCGGLIVGLLLLILAVQRKKAWAGVIALAACILIATPLGTLTTLVPAGALWLYLQRKKIAAPPAISPRPWWAILIWVLVFAALDLGLQIVATIFAIVPPLLRNGISEEMSAMRTMFSDGSAFLIIINAAWIVFLAILVACRPQNRDGWRNRLGLHPCLNRSAFLWVVAAGAVLVAFNFAEDAIMDARTKSSVELIALGLRAPVFLFLAVVLVAPVVEELTYRGFAYAGWIEKFGFWGTAFATTLIFTLLHVQYGIVGLAGIFVFGFILAAVRRKTGSIYPCIALHIFNNLVSVVGIYFAKGSL